jgi:4-aminobutyrate aminotransferase-like enzyme/Ser/Thr protein kinase RdoA (MazF antagonist)
MDPVLTHPPPALSLAEAEAITLQYFGKQAKASALRSERDQNFLMTGEDRTQWVLKVSNAAEDPAISEFQIGALLHVASVAPQLPVPRVCRSLSGDASIGLSQRSCGLNNVRLVSYLSGESLRNVHLDGTLRRALAARLAQLGLALRGYFHPAARHELLWNASRADMLRSLLSAVTDPGRRGLAADFLDGFEGDTLPRLRALRAQVIYNDLNPSNVVVHAGPRPHIAGIIDFGDIVHAPLISDVATAASYQLGGDDDPLKPALTFIAAYDEECRLEDDEIEVVFELMRARLVATAVITEWRAARFPENRDYIVRNQPAAWNALDALATLSSREATDRIWSACRHCKTVQPLADAVLLQRRQQVLGPAYRLFYDRPVHIVRGNGVWLYDADGRRYLDAYNNVPQVGHCHPRVVAALTHQAKRLNTHTRYLHESIVEYAARLTETFPEPLRAVMFTCTGSEANELALRLARTVAGGHGVIVTQYAYHGNTLALSELSGAYQSAEPPGRNVRKVPAPDGYRRGERDSTELASHYASSVAQAIESLQRDRIGVAALLVDTMFASDGILLPPRGYLAEAVALVRAAGGLFIADEVQGGFARTGRHMWSFEGFGLTPDIATLGKSIGNGHPLAALVTSLGLLERFGAGTRYFNTFGGNPVSAEVGLAVLDVLEEEHLGENAAVVGDFLEARLRRLAIHHPLIGDVRGRGLFLGVELVRDHATLEPAGAEAARVVNGLRERGVLVAAVGPHNNVLKIRPPLCFSQENAEELVSALDDTLRGI